MEKKKKRYENKVQRDSTWSRFTLYYPMQLRGPSRTWPISGHKLCGLIKIKIM